jgi:hypothetical protein
LTLRNYVDLDQARRQERSRTRKALSSPLPRWAQDCIKDDRDRLTPNLANALIALRAAPELVDTFAFDEMLRAPILRKALPLAPKGEGPSDTTLPRPVRDADVSQLLEWLQRHRHVATRRARADDNGCGFSSGCDDVAPRAHRRGAEHAV